MRPISFEGPEIARELGLDTPHCRTIPVSNAEIPRFGGSHASFDVMLEDKERKGGIQGSRDVLCLSYSHLNYPPNMWNENMM